MFLFNGNSISECEESIVLQNSLQIPNHLTQQMSSTDFFSGNFRIANDCCYSHNKYDILFKRVRLKTDWGFSHNAPLQSIQ